MKPGENVGWVMLININCITYIKMQKKKKEVV